MQTSFFFFFLKKKAPFFSHDFKQQQPIRYFGLLGLLLPVLVEFKRLHVQASPQNGQEAEESGSKEEVVGVHGEWGG
jgi:hypothetical protein